MSCGRIFPLPTTLLSITLESTLTTSLEHSLRSPLRALARDRKGVRLLSDQAFANHPPSIIKRTHEKEQRSCAAQTCLEGLQC